MYVLNGDQVVVDGISSTTPVETLRQAQGERSKGVVVKNINIPRIDKELKVDMVHRRLQ